jgi:hypothetical protein
LHKRHSATSTTAMDDHPRHPLDTKSLHHLLDTGFPHHLADTKSLHSQIGCQAKLLPHPARTKRRGPAQRPSPTDHDLCESLPAASSVETCPRTLSVLCRDVPRNYQRRPHSSSCGSIAPIYTTARVCSIKATFLARLVVREDSLIRPTVYTTTQSLDALTKTYLPTNVRSLAVSGLRRMTRRVSSGKPQDFSHTTSAVMAQA